MFYVYVESKGWLTVPGAAWSFDWEKAECFDTEEAALEASASRTDSNCIVLKQVAEL